MAESKASGHECHPARGIEDGCGQGYPKGSENISVKKQRC